MYLAGPSNVFFFICGHTDLRRGIPGANLRRKLIMMSVAQQFLKDLFKRSRTLFKIWTKSFFDIWTTRFQYSNKILSLHEQIVSEYEKKLSIYEHKSFVHILKKIGSNIFESFWHFLGCLSSRLRARRGTSLHVKGRWHWFMCWTSCFSLSCNLVLDWLVMSFVWF